jgi:hypothetical protein
MEIVLTGSTPLPINEEPFDARSSCVPPHDDLHWRRASVGVADSESA